MQHRTGAHTPSS